MFYLKWPRYSSKRLLRHMPALILGKICLRSHAGVEIGILHILVPIALSFLLAGLARENEGLRGHRIFELIPIFLIGCLKQRIP